MNASDCYFCHKPIAPADWEERHTPIADSLAEAHARCCEASGTCPGTPECGPCVPCPDCGSFDTDYTFTVASVRYYVCRACPHHWGVYDRALDTQRIFDYYADCARRGIDSGD